MWKKVFNSIAGVTLVVVSLFCASVTTLVFKEAVVQNRLSVFGVGLLVLWVTGCVITATFGFVSERCDWKE